MAPDLRKMFRRKEKSSSTSSNTKQPFCLVEFLDGSDPIKITYQTDTKGQYLLDYVWSYLDLFEKEYFGLRFVNSEKQRCWLDPTKIIQLQIKGVAGPTFSFRVRFYPPNPHLLKEEITRYFLFLQVKKDLNRGRLISDEDDLTILSAFLLQEELGDHEDDTKMADYVSRASLPSNAKMIEEQIADKHKQLIGMSPHEAEKAFLEYACQMQAYGMDPMSVKTSLNETVYLSLNHLGVHSFNEGIRNSLTQWQQIKKITFEGREFILHLHESPLTKKNIFKKNAKTTLAFRCGNSEAAKHLWKQAVAEQLFFTLNSSKEAPKVLSSGGLLRKSSKFRYSGLCLNELARNLPKREEPKFIRNTTNTEFGDTYRSTKTCSLPRSVATTNTISTISTGINVVVKEMDEKVISVDLHREDAEAAAAKSLKPGWMGEGFNSTLDSGVDINSGNSLIESSASTSAFSSKTNSLDNRASLPQSASRHVPHLPQLTSDAGLRSEENTPVNSPTKMALLDPKIMTLIKDLESNTKDVGQVKLGGEGVMENKKIENSFTFADGSDGETLSAANYKLPVDGFSQAQNEAVLKGIAHFCPQSNFLVPNKESIDERENTDTDKQNDDNSYDSNSEIIDNSSTKRDVYRRLMKRTKSPYKETSAHEEALNYHYSVANAPMSEQSLKTENSFKKKFSPLIGAVRGELASKLIRKMSTSAKELRKMELQRSTSYFTENPTIKNLPVKTMKERSYSTDEYLKIRKEENESNEDQNVNLDDNSKSESKDSFNNDLSPTYIGSNIVKSAFGNIPVNKTIFRPSSINYRGFSTHPYKSDVSSKRQDYSYVQDSYQKKSNFPETSSARISVLDSLLSYNANAQINSNTNKVTKPGEFLQLDPCGEYNFYERSAYKTNTSAEPHIVSSSNQLSPTFEKATAVSENIKQVQSKSLIKQQYIDEMDTEISHTDLTEDDKSLFKQLNVEATSSIEAPVESKTSVLSEMAKQTELKPSIAIPAKRSFPITVLRYIIAAILFMAILFFLLLVLNQEVDLPFSNLLNECHLFGYLSNEVYGPNRNALLEYIQNLMQ